MRRYILQQPCHFARICKFATYVPENFFCWKVPQAKSWTHLESQEQKITRIRFAETSLTTLKFRHLILLCQITFAKAVMFYFSYLWKMTQKLTKWLCLKKVQNWILFFNSFYPLYLILKWLDVNVLISRGKYKISE